MLTPDLVDKAVAKISRRADYEYFFDKLHSADWIDPLYEHGFFKKPEPEKREGNQIGFPLWPESRYLARVAGRAPEKVLSILLKLPDTGNIRVHEDCIQAVLQMRADQAAVWATKETEWIGKQSGLYLSLPDRVAQLVSYLAKGNQVTAALNLAAVLLAVLSDPSTPEQRRVNEVFSKSLEPRTRMDGWHYNEILKKYTPDLLAIAPEKTFTLLCDLLEKAVEYSTETKYHADRFDLSFIWRPAIESHEQNWKHGEPRDSLVDAVKDTGEKLIRDDVVQLPCIVEVFEQRRRWIVFKRLVLHLLRVFPSKAPSLVAERLTNHDYYEASELRHEYALLSRDCFRLLQTNQQRIILEWIAAITVDEEQERESYRRFMGQEPPPEMINPERTAKIRKLQRLKPIRDSLPADWRAKYDQWVREVGVEPEHPEFVSYHSMWTGPMSPKSAADLKQMSTEQVVAYLREWKAPGGHHDSSPEGLARSLTEAVTADPARFATSAYLFCGLDPTYVCGFFYGLREPVANQKQALPWEEVLKLCEWVVTQPREIPGRKSEYPTDTGWGWTRKAIADLIGHGFNDGVAMIPFGLRRQVWSVIEPLTDDPDPSPERVAKHTDPSSLSINSTRGVAMEAAIKYARWVRLGLEKERAASGATWRGFDELPEVKCVLESRLDPSKERTLAIRFVYGQQFELLIWLDEEWSRANMVRIFPMEQESRDLLNAAWEAHLFFRWPSMLGFKLLEPCYQLAVDRLGQLKHEWKSLDDPDKRLACHLMLLYGRGEITAEHKLIRGFYSKAPDVVCVEAMSFVGRSLEEQGQDLSEVFPRFVKLWEWRFAEIGQTGDVAKHREELAAFGSWFASAKFDDTWAMNRLLDVLRVAKKAEPDYFVMKRLVEVAPQMPEQTVECLRFLVEGVKDSWQVHGWRDEMKTILGVAIQGSNPVARDKAIELVHRLGAMGHFEYRDLLPTKAGGQSTKP